MGLDIETIGARTRKDNEATDLCSLPSASNTPLSFCIASEEDLDRNVRKSIFDSSYGVQSLRDTAYEPSQDASSPRHPINNEDSESEPWEKRRSTLTAKSQQPQFKGQNNLSDDLVEKQAAQTADSSPSRAVYGSKVPSMSQSLTSLSLDSQAPLSSLASSPKSFSQKSFRQSDDEMIDDSGSQAIVSSSEDETRSSTGIRDSAPQLIMPSIKMPSRRPFTDGGKAINRLKVLIAGDSGVGKSSLIKSIVQTCEDIVHVDPLSPNLPSLDHPTQRKAKDKPPPSYGKSTHNITEIFASTKPYPSWWSSLEETQVLRKRKSSGDIVLERNICFVDTPGYSSGMSKLETIDNIVQYAKGQLRRPFSPSSNEGDIVDMLNGAGGWQVDVVFYMISQGIKHEDIVYLERLNAVSNVIILLSKSDILSLEETEVLRRSITEQLNQSNIRPFQFSSENARQTPFTVCSSPSSNDENMDASLLMSPDYVQPLIPSELDVLIKQVFEKDMASCLRHTAATKLVKSYRGSTALTFPAVVPRALSNPIPLSPESPSSPSLQSMVMHAGSAISPFMQARIADHTQQEERLAQLRLAKWAADLQRSLQNERTRYESLAKGDRASWLYEKLEEVTQEESSSYKSASVKGSRRMYRPRRLGLTYQSGLVDGDDPLGLLHWNDFIKHRGWVALQVAGSFGILGAVAVWVVRSWSIGGYSAGDWSWQWWRES